MACGERAVGRGRQITRIVLRLDGDVSNSNGRGYKRIPGKKGPLGDWGVAESRSHTGEVSEMA